MVQTVAVIDYGSGNLHSVTKAIEHAGICRVIVTSDASSIRAANRVVLPGVGAMGDCMQGLKDRALDSVVLDLISTKDRGRRLIESTTHGLERSDSTASSDVVRYT